MRTQDYTSRVLDIVAQLKQERDECPEEFRFSDIYDADGNQYVNLVQEGGGVLGVALVGFTYVLEEMGIRFLSLGGTSAGSINALMLADIGGCHEPKSLRILERIVNKNFMDFVDGGNDARALVRSLDARFPLSKFTALARNFDELANDLGINPGDAFENWLSDQLQHKTWADLERHMQELHEDLSLRDNHGNERSCMGARDLGIKIAIVAADITTQTKADFPDMADLYYEHPADRNPASFVRASMSIPFFFEPQRIDLRWARAREVEVRHQWAERANYRGPLPREVLFVDGGVMSNFPIDLFHEEGQIPNRPTIGVKLGLDRRSYHDTTGIGSFVSNIFDGVRNLRDQEFLIKNPEYRELIEYIDVEGFNWIDFDISDERKIDLFERGAQAAARWLRRFQWKKYKDHIRSSLLQSVKPLMWELSGTRNLEEKLRAFGITPDKDPELLARIEYLRNSRRGHYHVLWIDDAFTYGLPVAILDSLNVYTYTVQNSDDARALLHHKNRKNGPREERIDLIITDATRLVDGRSDRIAGLRFAQELAHNDRLKDLPVLIYAHERGDLLERYRKYSKDATAELPANVRNAPGENTTNHRSFISEVVNNVVGWGKREGVV